MLTVEPKSHRFLETFVDWKRPTICGVIQDKIKGETSWGWTSSYFPQKSVLPWGKDQWCGAQGCGWHGAPSSSCRSQKDRVSLLLATSSHKSRLCCSDECKGLRFIFLASISSLSGSKVSLESVCYNNANHLKYLAQMLGYWDNVAKCIAICIVINWLYLGITAKGWRYATQNIMVNIQASKQNRKPQPFSVSPLSQFDIA